MVEAGIREGEGEMATKTRLTTEDLWRLGTGDRGPSSSPAELLAL
jgi:hypothetical protein